MTDLSVSSPLYVLDPPNLWRRETLDEMQVLYHRPSGQTHVLIEPVPQIIDCLENAPQTAEQVMAALTLHYQLEPEEDDPQTIEESDLARLTARLEEMVMLGFVLRVEAQRADAPDLSQPHEPDNAA